MYVSGILRKAFEPFLKFCQNDHRKQDTEEEEFTKYKVWPRSFFFEVYCDRLVKKQGKKINFAYSYTKLLKSRQNCNCFD